MKKILVITIFVVTLLGCNNQIQNIETLEINKSLTIQIIEETKRAIIIEELQITKLEINITGTVDKTVEWIFGSNKNIDLELPIGDYDISIKHYAIRGYEEISVEETSTFSIKPSVITLVKIIPGAVGFIEIEEQSSYSEQEELTDLETMQNNIIGRWSGVVTTPWIDPYNVEIEFKNDGTYSAISLDESTSALYYGTDDDSPIKTFNIYDLYSNGEGVASIVVLFHAGTTNTSKLDYIHISEDMNILTFEYWHRSEYGPVSFNLSRIVD